MLTGRLVLSQQHKYFGKGQARIMLSGMSMESLSLALVELEPWDGHLSWLGLHRAYLDWRLTAIIPANALWIVLDRWMAQPPQTTPSLLFQGRQVFFRVLGSGCCWNWHGVHFFAQRFALVWFASAVIPVLWDPRWKNDLLYASLLSEWSRTFSRNCALTWDCTS